MNTRDKAIIVSLYLSKYNRDALNEFQFNSFKEAFNVLGFSLGVKPASIKNYRDEFDPFFPNNRKGWHKRQIREYCKVFYIKYKDTDFMSFTEIINSILLKNYEIEKIVRKIEKKDYTESIAKRLLTGRAAEEYFKSEYSKINKFKLFQLTDTTQMACGFDYHLTANSSFYCVEVKGLNDLRGGIQLTEKEFNTAQKLKSNYCIFIVKNFKEEPIHDYIFDPLNSRLKFIKMKKEIIQTTYTSYIVPARKLQLF